MSNSPLDAVPFPLLYIVWFEEPRGKVAPAPIRDAYDGGSEVKCAEMGGHGRVQRFRESGNVIGPWDREVAIQGE